MSTLKDPLPRDQSELGRNRAFHGDKSYYYAHREGWEVPEHATVRSGPGLITGGVPVPLGPDGEPLPGYAPPAQEGDDVRDEVVAQLRARVDALERDLMQHRSVVKTINQFSFSDEGAKCKVYCELGAGVLEQKDAADEGNAGHSEAAVAVVFQEKTCTLRVIAVRPDGSVDQRFAATFMCESEVIPDKCAYKVDRTKGRVTLTFKKRNETKTWKNMTTSST